MEEEIIQELYNLLKDTKITDENREEINIIKNYINKQEYEEALELLKNLKQKEALTDNMDIEEEPEDFEDDEDSEYDDENEEETSEEDNTNDEHSEEEYEDQIENAESIDDNEYDTQEDEDEDDAQEDDEAEELEDVNNEGIKVKVKKEKKEKVSIYPKELCNIELERTFLGLLLNNPKLIVKYYILYKECAFEEELHLNIYKSIIFTEASSYTPEIAKEGFNFPKSTDEMRLLKGELKEQYTEHEYSMERTYLSLKKLFTLRKSYIETPEKEIQDKIVEITQYKLYSSMSIEEIKSAIEQVSVTQKFKQAILNKNLSEFLESADNNLTNGLALPFPILSGVFKGIRKGETMAFAMPSNSGKSRFTIDLAAYTAFVHRKKVLIISNEMSEEKMKLCLITTILNNPEIQKIHKQKLHKTEGELLEFKFRPDNPKNVKTDEEGFVLKEKGEKQKDFIKRLQKVSSEFNQTIKATDWVNKEINNSIYFINITDHTNDELRKVIMNYYYKEKIEYMFYDTFKPDTDNIGKAAEIKKTATILSNLAQNFEIFICSTIQLTENTTNPINLSINDLAISSTVKEVLDTLCLIKQIPKDNLEEYEYSLEEVDTKFFNLKKYDDPNVRYYACVVDKNRAGAKPKVLFRLNLAYNIWEELGYLKLKEPKK